MEDKVEKTLTPLEEKFVEYYIQTYNATLSIKSAGYNVSNDNVASVMGYENLRKPHIAEAIKKRTESETLSIKMETDEILDLLSDIARGNAKDVKVITRRDKVVAKQIDLKVKDRLKALELLGKNKAMFIDNIQTPFKAEDLVFNVNMVSSGKQAKEILDSSKEEDED